MFRRDACILHVYTLVAQIMKFPDEVSAGHLVVVTTLVNPELLDSFPKVSLDFLTLNIKQTLHKVALMGKIELLSDML